MGNIVALWVSASWPHPSSARVPQRRHPGLLGHGRPASNLLTQGGTGAARRDFFSWCVKAPQHFLSLQIKWVRASARKSCRLPLAASQTLCLPHPRVGKIASQASFRQRTKQCFLVQVLNHKTQEDRPSHRDRRSWVTSSPSGQNLGAQRQFSFPLFLV